MKRALLFVIIVVCVLTAAGTANASRFTVVNHTGVDLYELYVSPYRHNIWGPDLLHGRILRRNQSCTVIWNVHGRDWWDMQAKDSQDGGFLWVGLYVKDINKITVDPKEVRCVYN